MKVIARLCSSCLSMECFRIFHLRFRLTNLTVLFPAATCSNWSKYLAFSLTVDEYYCCVYMLANITFMKGISSNLSVRFKLLFA